MIRVALAVVLICLAGAAWAQDNFSRDDVALLQRSLRDQGYELGTVDGRYGASTAAAIRQYQADKGLALTGVITQELLDRLKEEVPGAVVHWQKTTNQDCLVWNGNPQPSESATWSGPCVDGKANGAGKLVWRFLNEGAWKTPIYEGGIRDGRLQGRGVYKWSNGGRYEGNYHEGKPHGHGVRLWASGDRYEGDWRDGNLHGHGVYVWANGDRYEGDVRDEMLHGRGIYVWANGNRYEGDYRDGKRTGRGVYMWANGSRYEGNYRDDLPHGFGDYLAVDGQIYVGTWTNGCYKQRDRKAAVGVPFSQCGF